MDDPTVKLCECGCGQSAPIAQQTETKRGVVKGQAIRFIVGHHNKVRKVRPLSERFWEKVDKRGPDDCWLWTASRDHHGYGMISFGARGQKTRSHRASWEIHNGPIPPEMDCLHKCDNPPCVNPSHLFLGTALDNVRDMDAKGRRVSNQPSGESHPSSRLTEQDVVEIRSRSRGGETQKSLAREYGVCQSNISNIILFKTWRHVGKGRE